MKISIFFIIFINSFYSSANTWVYKQQKDSFNDQTKNIANVMGKNKTSLTVRCDENSTLEIYFFFNEFLSSKSVPVRWRIDKREPQEGNWAISSEGTSVFSNNEIKNELARDLTKGSKVSIEATDFRGTKHRVAFSLRGSAKAISPVLQACNVEKTKITYSGVSEAISTYIDRMGPQSTRCLSRELNVNGYDLKVSHEKSKQLYVEAQKFLSKEMERCSDDNIDKYLKQECIKPSGFFVYLHSDAILRDKSISKECGSLKLEL